jgi:flagellar basal body-associated protein FliL
MLQNELRDKIVKILEQHTNANLASDAARNLIAEEIVAQLTTYTEHVLDVGDMTAQKALDYLSTFKINTRQQKRNKE